MMKTVKATREGEYGKLTACGYVIDQVVPFVALPSVRACHERLVVRVFNPLTQASCLAVVLDVGPWNTRDDDYVYGTARPQAESGTDLTGRPTNRAGIDLSDYVWNKLGMKDNGLVAWEPVS